MGHSRNTHIDRIKMPGGHTNKQPTDITHPPGNDNHSHPNINSAGTEGVYPPVYSEYTKDS